MSPCNIKYCRGFSISGIFPFFVLISPKYLGVWGKAPSNKKESPQRGLK